MSQGFVVWFTGLSGSGKSTLTAMLASELRRRGVHVETLDGDEVRKHLSKGLGFSRSDRDANIRRIGFVAKLVARSGGCAIAAAISPYREIRNEIRRGVGRFCEVYTECPLDVLAERDPKGLYKKALAGEIKNFTGVDDPYQAPSSPEVHLHTDTETPEDGLAKILERLETLGYIPKTESAGSVGDQGRQRAVQVPHGGDLVDRVRRGDLVGQLEKLAEGSPSLTLDAEALANVSAIATGLYSPLTGFVGGKDHLRILDAMRLETGAPWALPVTLDAPASRFDELRAADRVALRDEVGALVAVLALQDVWRPDRQREARALFGTTDPKHPGVRRLLARGDVYLGGQLECVGLPRVGAVGPMLDPRAVREALGAEGPVRRLALTSSGAPTLADEHALRSALDLGDAVVCAVGISAGDAPSGDTLRRCWETLLSNYFRPGIVPVGTYPRPGDLDPVRLGVHDAIVAKNLGCTGRIVVGPASSPPAPHVAELHVAELRLSRPVWSRRLGLLATERSSPAQEEQTAEARRDGTELRPEVEACLRADTEN